MHFISFALHRLETFNNRRHVKSQHVKYFRDNLQNFKIVDFRYFFFILDKTRKKRSLCDVCEKYSPLPCEGRFSLASFFFMRSHILLKRMCID